MSYDDLSVRRAAGREGPIMCRSCCISSVTSQIFIAVDRSSDLWAKPLWRFSCNYNAWKLYYGLSRFMGFVDCHSPPVADYWVTAYWSFRRKRRHFGDRRFSDNVTHFGDRRPKLHSRTLPIFAALFCASASREANFNWSQRIAYTNCLFVSSAVWLWAATIQGGPKK